MMIRLKLGVVGLLLIFSFSHTALAEEKTISVLDIPLQVGDEQSAVLQLFNRYRIQCLGDPPAQGKMCDSVIIQANSSPYTAYANLYFKNNKLKTVIKYWDHGFVGGSIEDFVQTLYGLLRNETGGLTTKVSIQTKEKIEPGVVQKVIFISKGNKLISVSVNSMVRESNVPQTWVNMSEKLE